MKTLVILISLSLAIILIGCDNDTEYITEYVYVDDGPPPVPQGVYSITGDEEVLLYWLPIDDVAADFDIYIVYRSDVDPDTGYWEIGQTTNEFFIDDEVANGHTYYYAISSVDVDGYVSDLSYEYVFDTPRPEGANQSVFDFNAYPQYAGWDLSAVQTVAYDSPLSDFFLEYYLDHDVFYINVSDIYTDIQDMGYTEDLDEINYSPDTGWSALGWCEVILGHTYIIWTADNHFAKIRVKVINESNIVFDWAYQVDPGNPELKPVIQKPVIPRPADYLRHPRNDTPVTIDEATVAGFEAGATSVAFAGKAGK